MAKITKTFSVETEIYQLFEKITDEKNMNKSSYIEEQISKFVLDNFNIDMETSYMLKLDNPIKVDNRSIYQKAEDLKNKKESEEDDVDVVKITNKSLKNGSIYVELSNGNVVKYSDFLKLYEKLPDPQFFLNRNYHIDSETKNSIFKLVMNPRIYINDEEKDYIFSFKRKGIEYTTSYSVKYVGKSRIDDRMIFSINDWMVREFLELKPIIDGKIEPNKYYLHDNIIEFKIKNSLDKTGLDVDLKTINCFEKIEGIS